MKKAKHNQSYGWVRFSTRPLWKSKSNAKKLFKNRKKGLLFILFWLFLIFSIWFTKYVLLDLPDLSQINDMVFSESTIIQDRNGKELYKLYEENREYVPYSAISPNMINALVAMEDQRYRDHSWLDPIWIIRAALRNVLHIGSSMQGASTIQQQLLKNLLLNKDLKRETKHEKVVRKLKEVVLIGRLNSVIEKEIYKESPRIDKTDLHKTMKEKVLELYLNYIALWNNAFGVEAASKTYFSKSAQDLNILESSILASIPKSPTIYNPYRNRERVIWELVVLDQNWTQEALTGLVFDSVMSRLTKNLDSVDFSKEPFIKTLDSVMSFSISEWANTYNIKYTIWRKDYVLARMFDDGYISQNELKQSFLQWLTYQLRRNRTDILAPHFVHRVIEELEKNYDKDTLFKWWFVITTTLDLEQQIIAEQSLQSNLAVLQENWANNSSMVYIDSTNWDVIAYVWSINYFDDKIQWQNDMVRRPRQAWSALKPFVYSLWFQNLPLTIDTPMFDIPFKIWQDEPNNADWKFFGLLPLKQALGFSRNIPATKMFLAAWWEAAVKPYLRDLGLAGVKEDVEYWYTLALWAAEITMLDMANAYMHLSVNAPSKINPILEIRSRDGSLIYKKEDEKQKNIIPGWVRSLLWNILSEPANRLAARVTRFNVQWLTLWVKTGTSNVKTDRWNRPRDGWMAAYNGTKVAVFWAWNADWAQMNRSAFGWTIHANPMRSFFASLVRNNFITNDPVTSVDVTSVDISKITWRQANENTPSEFVVSSLRYIHGKPLESDFWLSSFEYDTLCNGMLSPSTPLDNTKKWYAIQPFTMIPSKIDLAEITEWRKVWSSFTWVAPQWGFESGEVIYNYPNIFVTAPSEFCEERGVKEDLSISVSISLPEQNKTISNKFSLRYSVKAERWVKSVLLFANEKQIASFSYDWKNKSVNELKWVVSELPAWQHNMELLVVDTKWYSNKTNFTVDIVTKDTEAPYILENDIKVQKQDNGKYQVVLVVEDDLSFIESWKILSWDKLITDFSWKIAVFILDEIFDITVSAKDAFGNKLEKLINLPNPTL